MRKLFLSLGCAVFLLTSCKSVDYSDVDFFLKAKKMYPSAELRQVNLPTWMLKKMIRSNLETEEDRQKFDEIKKVLRDIKIDLISDAPATLRQKFADFVETKHLTEWMSIDRKDGKFQILSYEKGQTIPVIMLAIGKNSDLVIVKLEGDFSEKSIQRLAALLQQKNLADFMGK